MANGNNGPDFPLPTDDSLFGGALLNLPLNNNYISPFSTGSAGVTAPAFPTMFPQNNTYIPTNSAVCHKEVEGIKVLEKPSGYLITRKILSGSKLLSTYEADPFPPTNEMFLYYEEKSDSKSNLFGDFCLVKMGIDFREMLERVFAEKQKLNGRTSETTAIKISDKDSLLYYMAREGKYKMDTKVIEDAIRFQYKSEPAESFVIGNTFLNQASKAAIKNAIDALEAVKLKESSYQPYTKDQKRSTSYSPIIPVNAIMQVVDELTSNKDSQSPLKSLLSELENAKSTIGTFGTDNAAYKTISFGIEVVAFVERVIASLKEKLAEAKDEIEYFLQMYNAVLCGIINGFLSLIEVVLFLLNICVDLIFPTADLGKIQSGESYVKLRNTGEAIEDFIDTLAENWNGIVSGLDAVMADFSFEQLKEFLGKVCKKIFGDVNDFDIAHFCGSVIFEVVLGVILAFFTGGASIIAQAGTKAQKLVAFLKIVLRETISAATFGASELAAFFKSMIVKFVKAAKAGFKGLMEWLKDLLKLDSKAADDFVQEAGDETKNLDDVAEGVGKGANDVEHVDEVLDIAKRRKKLIDDYKSGNTPPDEKLVNGKPVKRRPTDYTRSTNFSEMVSIQHFEDMAKWPNGKSVKWKNLGKEIVDIDTPTEKGIDNILVNELFDGNPPPPKYIIVEVKHNSKGSAKWKPKLDKAITKSGASQMQDMWIEFYLRRDFSRELMRDVAKSSETYLAGVAKVGEKIDFYQITNDAQKLTKVTL